MATVSSVDPERLALSCCFFDADLTPLLDAGITADDFTVEDHRSIFEWALSHYTKHGESPSVQALRLHDANYKLADPADKVSVYIASIRERQQYGLVRDTLNQGLDLLDSRETDKAAQVILQGAAELAKVRDETHDEDITLTWPTRLAFYDELRANPGRLRGYPTGFESIDRATSGIQKGQYVMFVGPPKAGKSTGLMRIGQTINRHGAVGMLISFEMSDEEQKARWDGMWANVAYQKIMTGRLSADEMYRLERGMKQMEDGHPFILSTDIAHVTTVSGIAAKIDKHKPDFVLVDGVYMMLDDYGESPGTAAAYTNISRDIKRLNQAKRIPIICTTQTSEGKTTRRRGVTAESIMYSRAFQQDPDLVLGLQPADDDEGRIAELRVLHSRVGPRVTAKLTWDWDTMTFKETFNDSDDEASQPAMGGY